MAGITFRRLGPREPWAAAGPEPDMQSRWPRAGRESAPRTREQPPPARLPVGTPCLQTFLRAQMEEPLNCHSLELTAARATSQALLRVCTRAHWGFTRVVAADIVLHAVLSTRSVRPLHAQWDHLGGLCSKPNGQPCWGCADWPIVQSLPSAEARSGCLSRCASPWAAGELHGREGL